MTNVNHTYLKLGPGQIPDFKVGRRQWERIKPQHLLQSAYTMTTDERKISHPKRDSVRTLFGT